MLTAKEVKDIAYGLGSELCGIAAVDRFKDSPEGFHPADIYKDCKSVISFAKVMPAGILDSEKMALYTRTAGVLIDEIDRISVELASKLEQKGIKAIPLPSDDPYEYWDAERMHGMAILSMRHTAALAGLGALGRNTLLVNEKYGNMLYLGAVLTDASFDSDPMIQESYCPPGCRKCLDACPAGALDGTAVTQALCRKNAFGSLSKGYFIYTCNQCRKACPNRSGKRSI